LVEMERFVHSELASLNSKLGPTPSADALASYADARMGVFRECARFFVREFKTYGPMLGRIFREYEQYVKRAREAMTRARDLVRSAAGSRDAQAELYLKLREEFQTYDESHQAQLQKLYTLHQEGRSYFDLHADLDRATTELEREKQQRQEMCARLAMTDKVKNEFGRTLRAIESTFSVISEEKELRINKLERHIEELQADYSQTNTQLVSQTQRLRDDLEGKKIEFAALYQEAEIARDNLRHSQFRVLDLQKELQRMQDELDEREKELQEMDDRDDPEMVEEERERVSRLTAKVTEKFPGMQTTSMRELAEALFELAVKLEERLQALRSNGT